MHIALPPLSHFISLSLFLSLFLSVVFLHDFSAYLHLSHTQTHDCSGAIITHHTHTHTQFMFFSIQLLVQMILMAQMVFFSFFFAERCFLSRSSFLFFFAPVSSLFIRSSFFLCGQWRNSSCQNSTTLSCSATTTTSVFSSLLSVYSHTHTSLSSFKHMESTALSFAYYLR